MPAARLNGVDADIAAARDACDLMRWWPSSRVASMSDTRRHRGLGAPRRLWSHRIGGCASDLMGDPCARNAYLVIRETVGQVGEV